jgi:hypothetical protein
LLSLLYSSSSEQDSSVVDSALDSEFIDFTASHTILYVTKIGQLLELVVVDHPEITVLVMQLEERDSPYRGIIVSYKSYQIPFVASA